jgi:hypothetical protein
MGRSYGELISEPEPAPRADADLRRVRRPDVRAAARKGFGDLSPVQQASGVDDDALSQFFARGMLINVVA